MDFGNGFDSRKADGITVSQAEIYRYLGYRGMQPEGEMKELIDEISSITMNAARPQAFYRIYPVTQMAGDRLQVGSEQMKSSDLAKNMSGCAQAILLGATLGHEIDARLRLFGRIAVTKQVVLQAVSAAYLESYLDTLQNEIRGEALADGWYIRPRFSPGYGDFSLQYQTWIAKELQLSKRLGIVLSDSLMMIPSKSVTALIGVSREDIRCLHNGCEVCQKKDCDFRKARS